MFEAKMQVLKVNVLVSALAVVLLAGCAAKPTVSEYQCRAGDWQTIGFKDGAAGFASTQLLKHQEACGPFAIVPSRDEYLSGWQQGLTTYCTADNGFLMGRSGVGLNAVCNDELREPYASAYSDGRQLYVARRDVQQLSQKLNQQQNRLEAIKQELVGATTSQLVPDLTVEERIQLVAKAESLVEERAAILGDIPRTQAALEQAQNYLDQLDQNLALR